MKNSYLIYDDFISMRLDRWIKKNISDIPQSLIEKNIRIGNIKINNKKEIKLGLSNSLSSLSKRAFSKVCNIFMSLKESLSINQSLLT